MLILGMDKVTEVYITLKEATREANVSRTTILKYVKRGRLKAIYDHLPGRYLIELASLRAFANSRYINLPYKAGKDAENR
jgi:hypothetical protein